MLSPQCYPIVDAVGAGVYGVDELGKITFFNQAGARLLGYDVESLLGQNHHDVLRHANVDGATYTARDCPLCRALRDGQAYHAEGNSLYRQNGSYVPVECMATPGVAVEAGKLSVITFCDMSRHRALTSQLSQSQKLEAIGQLAAGIAHEMNTPMQYVSDNMRFLRDAIGDITRVLDACRELFGSSAAAPALPELQAVQQTAEEADLDYLAEEIPKAIHESLEGIDRVTSIVRALKEFSHPATGEKSPVDIHRAIQTTVTIARNEWKYVADMEFDFSPNMPLVPCFPGELNQVLLNLVVNAVDAISDAIGRRPKEKGKITFSTSVVEGWAEIRVSDTGTGIPEAIRSKIFDLFFTTKPVGRGTGQGLALVHSVIVEKHKGMIDLETEVGKGTTFVLRLPLQLEPAPSAAETPIADRGFDGVATGEEAHLIC